MIHIFIYIRWIFSIAGITTLRLFDVFVPVIIEIWIWKFHTVYLRLIVRAQLRAHLKILRLWINRIEVEQFTFMGNSILTQSIES